MLRQVTGGGSELIVIGGFSGAELPATLTNPVIDRDPGSSGSVWRLIANEGQFHFQAQWVERLHPCPELYEPLHRRFALSATDRVAARVLLWLLRLPGGARLLSRWHSRRR